MPRNAPDRITKNYLRRLRRLRRVSTNLSILLPVNTQIRKIQRVWHQFRRAHLLMVHKEDQATTKLLKDEEFNTMIQEFKISYQDIRKFANQSKHLRKFSKTFPNSPLNVFKRLQIAKDHILATKNQENSKLQLYYAFCHGLCNLSVATIIVSRAELYQNRSYS